MATTETGGGNGVTGARADNTIFTNEYSSNPSIANITDVAQRKWGGAVGTGVTLTYSFNLGNGKSVYSASYPADAGSTTAFGLNSTQQEAARQAMETWAAVANINFTEMQDSTLPPLPASRRYPLVQLHGAPDIPGLLSKPIVAVPAATSGLDPGQGGRNQNPVKGGYGFRHVCP
jgi:hypothetical protein